VIHFFSTAERKGRVFSLEGREGGGREGGKEGGGEGGGVSQFVVLFLPLTFSI